MRASVVLAASLLSGILADKPPCDSPIYCHGDLLHAVQMAHIYADDKTFVGKPTLKPVAEVLDAFARIGGRNATKDQLVTFLDTHFGATAMELKQVDLPDLDPNPPFLSNIRNGLLREYGATVHAMWATLVREQDLSVLCNGCASSMLELKHPFVVPGGRFTEIYYWDTFFTLEGMLRSKLNDLARSNILDLLALVDQYGFVPNGARNYYLDRSQPPLLTLMVRLYYDFTGDLEFVRHAYPTLLKEYAFWQHPKHAVAVDIGSGIPAVLNRYNVDVDMPRPESYSVDYTLAHSVEPDRQAGIYADMATGAESGWDYSTRWVRDPHAPKDRILQGIRTRQVVPVDLNAILYQVEVELAEMSILVGNNSTTNQDGGYYNSGGESTAEKYRQLAEIRKRTMDAVFYDSQSGLYFDYLLDEHRKSTVFSPASLWPYWSFGKQRQSDDAAAAADRAFSALASVLRDNPGGVPATLNDSGQQWDWPMAWPPLQYVAMRGALNTGHQAMALRLAQSYVNSVFCTWYNTGGSIPGVLAQLPGQTDTGHMFEKFNSSSVGHLVGQSGEYDVQAGFGWTNGVLLWTLDSFGQLLDTPECPGMRFLIKQQTPSP
ncbi:hypothetical protein EV175_001086 [Coemansia sp. RSA 1933]|nr:hypothetical protein EV175_001086 [Coemansia sp. RSA 1933]